MREILFRGKRKDNGEWIQGGIYVDGDRIYIITLTQYRPDTRDWNLAEYYENHPVYRPTYVEVIPETVGQYIGMGDKNSIKIFEGDILNYNPSFSVIETYVIEFDSASFCHRNIDFKFPAAFSDCESGLGSGNYLEIIGNIHDNPELMPAKQKGE